MYHISEKGACAMAQWHNGQSEPVHASIAEQLMSEAEIASVVSGDFISGYYAVNSQLY